MFSFLGYNFSSDKDALNQAPTNCVNITQTRIQNGVYDHINVTRDVKSPMTTEIPTIWQFLTILNATLNGNIDGGNIDFALDEITSIKVKRRVKGTFGWTTIKDIPIHTNKDLTFELFDHFNQHAVEYEYAFVPMLQGVEGNYIVGSVLSELNGVFICDADTIYKFYANTQINNLEQVQKVGVFEPLGRKFPIVVANAKTNYAMASFTGTVLHSEYEKTRTIDSLAMQKTQKVLQQFLTNKKAKILKDWNGNIWLICVVGNPTITFNHKTGDTIGDVSFSWVEQGEVDNEKDLIQSGLVKLVNK